MAAAARQDSLRNRIEAVLAQVPDPEIPVLSVMDLGIVREVREDADGCCVILTPTYSGCPATQVIERDVREALAAAGLGEVPVQVQLSPRWSTDWITPAGREKLRAYGIAPPVGSADKGALFGDPQVPCPRCNSTDTEKLSEFGSTPCKAHWRCRACLEPFDYFKCH